MRWIARVDVQDRVGLTGDARRGPGEFVKPSAQIDGIAHVAAQGGLDGEPRALDADAVDGEEGAYRRRLERHRLRAFRRKGKGEETSRLRLHGDGGPEEGEENDEGHDRTGYCERAHDPASGAMHRPPVERDSGRAQRR